MSYRTYNYRMIINQSGKMWQKEVMVYFQAAALG
jgi:hypothetical protein